ncbi:MAG TPA: TIGR03084 family metal-binding protein [Mycobacteriales bacterium]|nr:TIGR03084 family metal-binding protein [Mycobacteriales bacterium]
MVDRPSLTDLLDDLRAEQRDLRDLVERTDLALPTPAEGWDVRDTVSHLAGSDEEAHKAATTPQLFLAGLPEIAKDIDGFLTGQLTSRRGLSRQELMAGWQAGFDAMVDAFADLEPGTKVPWYGPPMSPVSFATARLMEYWAHGQDVADAARVRRTPTARLRHICHLGVRTRGFSYVVRGRTQPHADVAVELTAPDGGTWSFGDVGAHDRVTGPAEDFCLLVTQRRHRADTALVADGAAADEWLDLAQCFAGPPGPGRAPLVQR